MSTSRKHVFIFLANKWITPQMIHAATYAGCILYKEHASGFIYLLKFEIAKMHSTVEKTIKSLDETLMRLSGTSCTSFISIDTDLIRGGKIRSFQGNGRIHDKYFRLIYDIRTRSKEPFKIQMDVKVSTFKQKQLDDDNDETYDVVKKRKAMDAAPPPTTTDNDGNDDDNDPKALAAFEDFELSVLPALEKIKALEWDDNRQEMLEMEDMIEQGLPIKPTGGVYFAWSDCLQCMKIGATRRDDPHIRLREISRGVTSPFVLSGWLPSPTPFRAEAKAHLQFAAQRIKCAGAGTEFFTIGKKDAEDYVAAN